MEHIRNAKYANVHLVRRGTATKGSLHLTPHHMIFSAPASGMEVWVCYPMIQRVEREQPRRGGTGNTPLRIRCRDFSMFALDFADGEAAAIEAFSTLQRLTCVDSLEQVYAFTYSPGSARERAQNGWKVYDPQAELARLGLRAGSPVAHAWRITRVNASYAFSATYPATFAVPHDVSDNVISYAGKYRSKARIPALTYVHARNGCTITRSSQPMVGLKGSRSPQDERLVEAIFTTRNGELSATLAPKNTNLIVDARPTANAMANVAIGAGSELMEYYPHAHKVFLGIDNIHVMRDSLARVVDVLKDSDVSPLPPNRDALQRTQWLKHIASIVEGADTIRRAVDDDNAHVLVHCSDGWDRTSQLCALAELCLDPYYRTLDGFITLVEKDWLAFGHRFAERAGHLLSSDKAFVVAPAAAPVAGATPSSPNSFAQNALSNVQRGLLANLNRRRLNGQNSSSGDNLKLTSPVFHQFLDCTFQLMHQYPSSFEFNERFLRRLLYHTYSCQYGTFLYNTERERHEARVHERTRSVWDYFLARRNEWRNAEYTRTERVLVPDAQAVRWWAGAFGWTDAEMNGSPVGKARSEMAGMPSDTPPVGKLEMEMSQMRVET